LPPCARKPKRRPGIHGDGAAGVDRAHRPAALSQIVINLVNNAIKFTERGGVRIRAERREENGSRALEISVEDTGIGIRPEDQKKLFGALRKWTIRPIDATRAPARPALEPESSPKRWKEGSS